MHTMCCGHRPPHISAAKKRHTQCKMRSGGKVIFPTAWLQQKDRHYHVWVLDDGIKAMCHYLFVWNFDAARNLWRDHSPRRLCYCRVKRRNNLNHSGKHGSTGTHLPLAVLDGPLGSTPRCAHSREQKRFEGPLHQRPGTQNAVLVCT